MAVVLPGKFVFLATPHTSSAPTERALSKINGAFAAYDKRHGIGHHASWEQVKKVCGSKLQGNELVFTTIRNPYDVLSSWYVQNRDHYQMRRLEDSRGYPATLMEFLDIWLQLDAKPYLQGGKIFHHAEDCDKVIRYENLHRDLEAVLRQIPGCFTAMSFPLDNEAPGRLHWTEYFDDDSYAFVNRVFQKDFVKYGFPFIWSNNSLR